MKKIFSLSLSLTLLFCAGMQFRAAAQQDDIQTEILNHKVDNNTFIFDGDIQLSTFDFLTGYSGMLNIGPGDVLQYDGFNGDPLTNDQQDTFYYVRIRFTQTHNNVRVDKAGALFTENDNVLQSIVGNLVKDINASEQPAIMQDDALNMAMAATGAGMFKWQNQELEDLLKETTGDPNATYYPKPGELVYTWQQNPEDGNDYVLAWRFEIAADEPDETYEVYINAASGATVKINSLTHACGQVANGNTLYNGNRSYKTHYRGFPNYNHTLNDCGNWDGDIETLWYSKHGSTYNVTNGGTNWGYSDQSATTPHWAASASRDYYKYVWGRRSLDNAGAKVTVRADMPAQNAYYTSSDNSISIGVKSGTGQSLGALDIVGHEYTHGITRYTGGLVYSYESGALNESFSDIFGNLIQRYITGSTSWDVGEDVWLIRSMSNPNAYAQPAYYHGAHWYSGSGDNGGVHTNSGVQNKWFYNLSNYIGIDKAAGITYRNLTTYMYPTAQYINSYYGSVQAAKDLYGVCSDEVTKTRQAWADVGVGWGGVDPTCVTIKGTASVCSTKVGQAVIYKYYATSGTPASSYTWNVYGANMTYTTSGNVLTVTKFNDAAPKIIKCTANFSGTLSSSKKFYINFIPNCGIILWPSSLTSAQLNPDAVFAQGWVVGPKPAGAGVETASGVPYTVSVFPNPASDKIMINVSGNSAKEVSLIDIYGRVLKQITMTTAGEFNVTDIASGMYTVRVQDGTKTTVRKITVMH